MFLLIFCQAFDFIDHFNGWAVGDGGTIIQTFNGGFSHDNGTFGDWNLGLPIIDKEECKSTIEVNVSDYLRDEYYHHRYGIIHRFDHTFES